MTKAAQLIENIKLLFNSIEPVTPVTPQAPVPIQYTSAALADGTPVEYDKLEAGGILMIAGVAALAGEYTLMDGTSLTVTDGGVIAEVELMAAPPADPVAPPVVPPAEPNPAAMNTAKYDEMFAAYEARIVSLENLYKAFKEAADKSAATVNTQTQMMKQIFELIENIAGTPTVEPPVQKKKFSFSNIEVKDNSLSKYQQAAARMKAEFDEKLKIA